MLQVRLKYFEEQEGYLGCEREVNKNVSINWMLPAGDCKNKEMMGDLMYRYIDCLTHLFTKYKYIWYLATMFRPFTGSSSGLYNKLESVLHFFKFCVPTGIPCGLVLYIVCKSSNTLSSLLYRPDGDPVKGQNIVAKYQIYLYLVKSCVRRSIYWCIRSYQYTTEWTQTILIWNDGRLAK
jgi:hypothetical protein